ncbi:glycosyltransferase [Thioclava sp. GXIMD4215]|uniref:glycosyltransferase n=1 Tax=Thioclava sp. GXIMD4215 TaxID=3131928 RepID=UPI0032461AD4
MKSISTSLKKVLKKNTPVVFDLPGFNSDQYLKYNPDVAEALKASRNLEHDALQHYCNYGASEYRRVFENEIGLSDFSSRLIPAEFHKANSSGEWFQYFERLVATQSKSLPNILKSHPRAGWLSSGFNYTSYAAANPDILKTTFDATAIHLHFLEFGLEKGETGYPDSWDPQLIGEVYGVSLPEALNGPQALRELRRQKGPGPYAMNEAELFILNGFAPILANLFEEGYSYGFSRVSKSNSLKLPSRVSIVQSFCRDGWKSIQPIRPDLHFDADFYKKSYHPLLKGPAGLTEAQALYKHWLSVGILLDDAPNLPRLGKVIFGTLVPQEILSQLDRFKMGSEGLPKESSAKRVLEHLRDHPRPGLEWVDLSARVSQSFVRNLGDSKVIAGDAPLGRWLYSLVLEANERHVKANMAMADLLQRTGQGATARVLRRRVPITRENGWNSLNLTELLLGQGKFDEAAEVLQKSALQIEHDIVMRDRHKALATDGFWKLWDTIADRAEVFGLDKARADLRHLVQSYRPNPEHNYASRSEPIRSVALVGNEDLYQCKLYRVDQKAEQLREAGFEVQVFSPSNDLNDFLGALDRFQAVIFFRVPAFPQIMDAIVQAGQAGLATFYEIDDIVFDTAHFPPSFESYANQITRREYNAMACGVPLFERAMELCEYGIASTATLRELMAKKVRSGQVFEHQNALGRLHMLAIADHEMALKKADGPIVLFYGSGTKAHKEDFHEILEPALAEMARKYGRKIEIHLIGYFDKFNHLDLKKHNVKMLKPVWDFEEYCGLVAQADINLSILSPSLLTDAKSEIKWMEAAMFGTPSVVSATRTHEEKIVNGETGFLCETTEDFSKALDRLIGDKALRASVGAAARETVLKEYSLPAMGENLRSIFEAVRPSSMRKKRIAIVNVFYPPQAIGGATRVVHDNVRVLREKYGDEFEIDVICTYEGGRKGYEVQRYARDGVRVWAIATPDIPNVDHPITDEQMGAAFEEILDKVQPDLVHFHCIQRLTTSIVHAARLRQIPYVITMHDAWWISKNQFVLDNAGNASFYDYKKDVSELPERAQGLRRALLGAAAILPVSEAFGRVVAGAGVEKLHVVENGVSNLPNVVKVPSKNGRVRLAHIGGASRHKGYHHVRNTLLTTDFDNLELLVIDHALSPDIEIQETWGNTPVIRRGKFAQDEVEKLYAQIDVLMAPSTWPESYGLVTREALAAGAWVVASDQGAIGSDVIEGENGFVVEVQTVAGVRGALQKIDEDPERYRHSPQVKPVLRSVEQQVDELAQLYKNWAKG